MKSSNASLKSTRLQVILLLIAGIAIGTIGTWLVAEQFERVTSDLTSSSKSQEQAVEQVNEEQSSLTNSDIEGVEFEVDWMKSPKELTRSDALELFTEANPEKSLIDVTKAFGSAWKDPNHDANVYQFSYVERMWEVGTVSNEAYRGDRVFLIKLSTYDLGFQARYQYIVQSSTGSLYFDIPTVDEAYENQMDGHDDFMSLVTASTFSVQATAPARELTVNGFKYFSTQGSVWSSVSYRFEMDPMREVARASDGTVLWEHANEESRSGCLYAFGSDGKSYIYGSNIEESVAEDGMNRSTVKPSVAWKKGYENSDTFIGTEYGGCGSWGCVSLISDEDVNVVGGVVSVGTTARGAGIYIPARIAEHPLTQLIYDGWYVPNGESKPSMEEFLKRYPVPFFFWKDALGRWNIYRSDSVLPMAECGKPVIYLYPEKKTNVRVALPSFIDVNVSDPSYPEKGWSVTAYPNGDLVSKADGKTYGSLFWEGTGAGYESPTSTGFVVARDDVSSFFTEVLPKYGLNQKESTEFMDFWVPRMTESPYYLVSFLTDEWSKAVPLRVSPIPDTSIRLFMDLKPLSAPISVREPVIVTPVRSGFTLVEWGGLLLQGQ